MDINLDASLKLKRITLEKLQKTFSPCVITPIAWRHWIQAYANAIHGATHNNDPRDQRDDVTSDEGLIGEVKAKYQTSTRNHSTTGSL